MKITNLTVRNSQFTLIVFVCLIALGVTSFRSIPRMEDPAMRVPSFSVVAIYPGANATDIEQLVARPLEDALKELDDIDKLRATVKDGFAYLTLDFTWGTDPEEKYDEVLRQVNVERPKLPSGVVEVDVRKWQTTNVAMMQVALVSPDASYARLQDLADALRKRFERVDGVRQARRHAFPEKQVRVSLDIDRLTQLRIPLGQIVNALQGANVSIAGGSVEAGDRRFNIKTSGNYADLDEVRMTPIAGDAGAVVYLKDVADVRWTTEDLETFGRYNGERAVFVTVRPRAQQNLSVLSQALRTEVEAFRSSLAGDVRLEIGWDQSQNVERRLGRLQEDFLFAFALVLLTVLPLGLRASVLVMLSIPLSLAMGVAALYFTGFSLNQLSIVGFVIALGLLVDDSIVVVENIARFRRMGTPPIEAAVRATEQIAVAVAGTTATLLFAFLPLLMLPGGPGQYIRSLPVAVVYTVLASMVVALTIIPLLASLTLRGNEKPEGNLLLRLLHRGIESGYRPVLHWCMQHRGITLGAAALLIVGSLALVPRIGFSLFPKAGLPQFLVQIEMEEGASVAATDAVARRVEALLAQRPEVANYFTTVGDSNPQIYYNEVPQAAKASVAELFVSLKVANSESNPRFFDELRSEVAKLPGAQIVVKELENGPPIEAPIAVRVFAENIDQIAELAANVERVLRGIPGTHSITNPVRIRRTDLRLVIDKPKAALLGVPEIEIDRAVRLAFGGLDVSRFREADGDEYDIQLALPRGERATLENWGRIQVQSRSGAYLPLAQLARLQFESAPPVIQRFNRERSATVTALVADGFNVDQLTRRTGRELERLSWPTGTRWEFGGEVESRSESFGGLGSAVVIAAFGILAILVLEFRSFRGTAIVASVIPLGVIGGLLALWLTGYSLSFTAAIGFVALIGIETKNSILLVDFTNQLRAQGVGLKEAIERAGEIRFLPVVLTTLTALGALAPLALQRSGLYSPLAIVIMGGLISSLLLSRLVTPVLYSLMPPPNGESHRTAEKA
ncbi:efflux RND transporter permease subunit [Opitutus terrae]|uniref:Acriflavin resistance protein n=1 Tax=Opitutus terrae (strain DSM 11246 / JCM 15787 / PB90-1) TaxID=452637 RepID=B1ZRV4_OPITP|nr:efflux RND transporter permease subunit [Opitutus terrae]ACB73797.1 acriflavin resistance protein [Opitutus terrae PB90-1]